MAEPDAVETTDAETKALPDGFTAVGKGSDEVGADPGRRVGQHAG